ncbi:MAG: hypothetical protein WCS99_20870 [Limisphaerales bacterium]
MLPAKVTSASSTLISPMVAVVSTREEVSTEELRKFLHTLLPDWQIPREWRLVESLTVNARGKLSRAEWRGKFRSEQNHAL